MAATIAAAIAVGSVAPGLYQQWRGSMRSGDFSEHVANQPYTVTLYGTTTCPYCIKARAYLKKEGIPFNDRIVDESNEAEALYAKLDQNSVPVLVSGKSMIVGFTEPDYDAFIASVK